MGHSTSHIKTERLWLREIDESDTDTIVRLRSEPEVYRYFSNPHGLTADGHRKWYWGNYVGNTDRTDWIALDDESGHTVGVFGAEILGKYNGQSYSIGLNYIINPDDYGRGYASEAICGIMQYCISNLPVERFVAKIHIDNIKSSCFIKRMGFSFADKQGDFQIYQKICKQLESGL